MTKFIMLVGLPASGKSTYAEKLKEKGYHIHSSDKIREELTGDVNSQDKNIDVFAELHKRVKNDLQNGISCVYDATNMSRKRRVSFLNDIKNIECEKICILFLTPIEECKRRNQERERKVPEGVFDKMLKSFWVPMEYEGWDRVDVGILEGYEYHFPIEKTYNFDQCNSRHSKRLFDHMNDTALYIQSNTNQNFKKTRRYRNLMLAAYYHDIGKLYTQTFINSKGEETEDAHYYGHDGYGAYLYLLIEFYGCLFPDDARNIAALINWHMSPYITWEDSEKAMKRDRRMIGEEMYQDIMLLHEADVAAH